MSLKLTPSGTANGVFKNNVAISVATSVVETDLVETRLNGAHATITIPTTNQCAAQVNDANSAITVYIPPSYSLDRVYYNNSFRYKLSAPGGYVGIRG